MIIYYENILEIFWEIFNNLYIYIIMLQLILKNFQKHAIFKYFQIIYKIFNS
jgi:hypothetical protein